MSENKMKYGEISRDKNGQVKFYDGGDEDLIALEVDVDGTKGYVMKPASEYADMIREPRGTKKDAQRKKMKYKKRNKKSR